MSATRQLTVSAALLSLSVVASRLLGFVRDAVIAYRLGAGLETDAYIAAFFLPDLLNYLLSGGALSITFIPLFSRHLEGGNAERGWQLFSRVVTLLGTLLGVASVAAWFAAPAAIRFWYPEFGPEQIALTTDLTRIVLAAPLFFLVGGLLNATEMAHKRFVAAALAPLVYNVCIIAGGLVLEPSIGVAGFSWGALAGAALGPFLVPALYARADARFRVDAAIDDDVRRFFYLALPLMVGVTLIFFDQRLCERYATGEGAITWLNNARRLLLVPVGIIGQAIGQAALPYLATLHARGDERGFDDTIGDAVRGTATLALVAAAALALAAVPISELVYGRGAYTPTDVEHTGQLLAIFSAGLVGWSVQTVALRGFYAREAMWPPMLLGTAVVLLVLPLYPSLEARFGASGLAMASSLAVSANLASILILYRVVVGRSLVGPVVRGLADGAIAAAPAAAIAGAAHVWLFGPLQQTGASPLLRFALLAMLYGAPAIGVLLLTGGPAARAVRRRLKRRTAA